MQTIKYKRHEIEIVPAVSGGFYCRWNEGETRIMGTAESAVFLAEKMIDAPELYGQPKREEWDYLFG
jgi:hypothetical protein